ncbi:MAG: hypothetical protein J7K85_00580 [Anaerolineaceae bacterium]|nr:hypothetical protein [Anaerolineaceae bacterium]
MKKYMYIFLFLLSFMLVLSACNKGNSSTEDAQAVYTQAAATVAVQLTEMADEKGTSTPTVTITASPTAKYTEEASATETKDQTTATEVQPTVPSECSNIADFVADITYPDGAQVLPGESFTKIWQMINNGTCTWNSDYLVIFIDGDDLGAPAETPLTTGIEVPAGMLINISIDLIAPETPGTYTAYFKFKTADGDIFGINSDGLTSFYVTIEVVEPTPEPTNTSVPTETPTPTATTEAVATEASSP